jgi:glycosyltransferase involved in cell wall biosynthesis
MDLIVDGIIYQQQSSGGISNLFRSLLPRMCEFDPTLQVTLFYTTRPLQPLPMHARIRIIHIPALEQYIRPWRYFHPLGSAVRMQLARQYFKKFSGAIWHSTYFTDIPSWSGPTVVTVHDMIYERYPDIFKQPYDDYIRARKRRCIQNADVVLCDSETTRADVERYLSIDSHKCRVVHLACSSIFRVLQGSEINISNRGGMPYLLYVGRRHPHKNFTTLARAFGNWKYQHQVGLIVASDSTWTGEELDLLRELSIHEQVKLVYSPTDEQLCQLYNGASALVFPSIYEGFGIPLLEAMNCGCPIVASYIPSTLEVAGDIPIYFNPGSTDELIQALNLALDEGRNSARVTRGFGMAQQYSWDTTAQKTLDIYHSLL